MTVRPPLLAVYKTLVLGSHERRPHFIRTSVSWTQRINNPADVYRNGDQVEAIILSINHDEKKVSLGIKQLWT